MAPRSKARTASSSREKVSTRIARAIARDVAEQGLPAGTVLADEKAMAQSFGVGRNSVREALRLLEAQGLIELRRGVGGGPVVAEANGEELGKTMTMFLQMRGTSFRELGEALAALEGFAAGLAAAKAPACREEDFAELVSVLHHEDLALHVDADTPEGDPFSTVGIDFHRALCRFIGNDVISLLFEAVEGIWVDRTRAVRQDQWRDEDRARVHRDHVLVFDAIRRGDRLEAGQLMAEHIRHEAEDMSRLQPSFLDSVIDWR